MSIRNADSRNFVRRLRDIGPRAPFDVGEGNVVRVYHFTSEKYALSNLANRRLKIATINDLNDPYEWNWLTSKKPEVRRAIARTKARMSADYGLICFSASWQNPVQWSHYADRHRGLCLGFEVPKKYLSEVKYYAERQVLGSKTPDDIRMLMIRAKFKHWEYEQEWRLFEQLDRTTAENGLYFCNFSTEMRLRRVIIGPDCNVSEAIIRSTIGDTSDSIEVFKARRAFKSFKIVRQKNRDLWPRGATQP